MKEPAQPANGIPKALEKKIWAWFQIIGGLFIFGVATSASIIDQENRYARNAAFFGFAALYFVWDGIRKLYRMKKSDPEPINTDNPFNPPVNPKNQLDD